MKLNITGGFGGPATWQELSLSEATLGTENFAGLKSQLEKRLLQPSVASNSSFPDGLQYDFEFGPDENRRHIQFNDASIPDDVRRLIHWAQQALANGTKDGHREET